MTVKEFFSGIFNFPISSEMVATACYKRGFHSDEYIEEMDTKTQDLTLADILVMLSRVSQGYTEKTGTDAFSMSVRGDYIPLADRQAMRNEANKIYAKYGENENVKLASAINIY